MIFADVKKFCPTKSDVRRRRSGKWGGNYSTCVGECKCKLFFRYKEFCIHSANVHGGLVEALLRDEREELRALAPKFKAIRTRLC